LLSSAGRAAFFSSAASDVAGAVWEEEVCGGGASTWTAVCPGELALHSWRGRLRLASPGPWAVQAAERALVLPVLHAG